MSRTLDKGVKEALKRGNHAKVFAEISGVLTDTFDGLLEIELLGPSHILDSNINFLQDSNAVALPKLRLVQAFIVARQILLGHIQDGPKALPADLTKATAVILLMDPEHLTAANTRKRLFTNQIVAPEAVRQTLEREKYFLDSLLTSRLHRHTKSPTLWSHRRWLMDRFRDAGVATDAVRDLREVVFVSGERHPRNYYAWCHARHLLNGVETEDSATLSTILADTKRWCFTHHDDVSGWGFLMFLLDRAPGEAGSTITESLKLVESFHWRNESVWYFLRNVLRKESETDRREDEFWRAWTSLRVGTDDESKERRALDQAKYWIENEKSM